MTPVIQTTAAQRDKSPLIIEVNAKASAVVTLRARQDKRTVFPPSPLPPKLMRRTKAAVPKRPPTLDTNVEAITVVKLEKSNLRLSYMPMANDTADGPNKNMRISADPAFL
mmetsp:Transcript_23562/g.65556  ORF Transcript_23562/g.65556 Transcript_23562/m.65556 type:complete len:111 (+) Transcript_23562:349-681(+)